LNLRAKPLSKKKLIDELKKIREQDQRYEDGKILCSMCTKPHPIAQKAYTMFLDSNLGDPALFPGTAQLEREVVKQLATLLSGENCGGFIVSGGTEANLMALLAARNMAQLSQPEVILAESAHFSFTKICNMLNLEPVYARLDSSFRVDLSSVKECLSKNTIAIVCTAGTAELGAVDPVEELSRFALDRKVWLHVDAAFGGLVIPFLNNASCKFDFNLGAVQSITVDPHKMGMSAIPAGGIIFKDPKMLNYLKTETSYLTDKAQFTLTGTRSGASVASAWAVFNALGMEGFHKIVKRCMGTTSYLTKGLKQSGFKLVIEPQLNLVAFRSKSTKILAQKLWQRGWLVSYVPRYDCIRIVVMPHMKKQHAQDFLRDLVEIEKL
jgi:tyrosine decarboxylase / aspartate 1-decarboxylase